MKKLMGSQFGVWRY